MTKRRLTLLIGPSEKAAARFRGILKEKTRGLSKQGIAAPQWNHVRLYAACAEADDIGVLRHQRGMENPLVQQTLTSEFQDRLAKDLDEIKEPHIVLCAAQLGSLFTCPPELDRLKALFVPYFDDIQIVAHVEDQARMLTAHYAYALAEGRQTSLQQELDLARDGSWWNGALSHRGDIEPEFAQFNDIQCPPHFLDFTALLSLWEGTFGKGNVSFRAFDLPRISTEDGSEELDQILSLKAPLGKVAWSRLFMPEADASLTRMRLMNVDLVRLMRKRDLMCPRDLWQNILMSVRIPGKGLSSGALHPVSACFAQDNQRLIDRFPDLQSALHPDPAEDLWTEADPTRGFRTTQYLAAQAFAIKKHATPLAEKRAQHAAAKEASSKFDALLAEGAADADTRKANKRLLNRVKVNHQMVLSTQFRPHNDLGAVNEEELAAAYAPIAPRTLAKNDSGNVIVGCMKNEAPYIIEWVAYHRAIGFDNFLIYTNDCSDGTDEILGRLQDMGILEHRNNDNWKGNSPQQHALNQSLKEPVIKNARWIAHIDVDEFMNIRTGNGSLDDLFAAVPDATNIAMTWRLFGHNGVTELRDDFVIDQFDTCAPKYCPKPHTVWGFKTMFRNIGAYGKISCHRPNKLSERFEKKVKWVNGSGSDMTRDAAHNGWRSSKSNIGYDLLQLNHYALRSAESFLIKRQRGRALHVDRSIGINYWIRMDWSDFRDITIKRNIPRLRAEYDRLMADDQLAAAHQSGLDWHRAKADELHKMPEFRDLYQQALSIKLNETERVAYALSLDMES